MNIKEAVAWLADKKSRKNIEEEIMQFTDELRESGLVLIIPDFGQDTFSMYGAAGWEEYLDFGVTDFSEIGLMVSRCQEDDCPYFEDELRNYDAMQLTIVRGFDRDVKYTTEIPHVIFRIREGMDDSTPCIVFKLSDADSSKYKGQSK